MAPLVSRCLCLLGGASNRLFVDAEILCARALGGQRQGLVVNWENRTETGRLPGAAPLTLLR
jgi:hypothetical protein